MSNDAEGSFDVVILGTGLTESIAAAALSKANYKVAHIDTNPYYGGSEATLSQDELIGWGEAVNSNGHTKFSGFSATAGKLPYSRQYSICLRPSVIPALGPLISSLIGSGVSKYSGFKLLDSVSIYSADGTSKSVPGSKEDVFNNKDISLIEKRRLMRFLTFAAGKFEDKSEIKEKEGLPFVEFLTSSFSLTEDIASVIAYSLAHCTGPHEPTLPSLLRIRSYLKSIGRYGPSPFLIGHYGGIGDISQGFCRAAAVSGAVYILGRPLLSASLGATPPEHPITITLDDFPEPIHCKLVISMQGLKPAGLDLPTSYVPDSSDKPTPVAHLARGIVIIDKPLHFASPVVPPSTEDETTQTLLDAPVDSALLIFPPSSVEGGSTTHAATVHITGEASISTPKGKWIVYFMLPLPAESSESAESIIRPYVNALLTLPSNGHESPIEPISSMFFFENSNLEPQPEVNPPSGEPSRYIIVPELNYTNFPDLPDSASRNAEAVFRKAVQTLRSLNGEHDDETEIDFWPPLDMANQDDSDSET